MKAQTFPMVIERNGVVARIYKSQQVQNGETYPGFVVSYRLLGKRKQVWRSNLDEAKAAADDACLKISNGEQLSLSLTNGDRMTYLRAQEAIAGHNIPIDVACRFAAEGLSILGCRASISEACREWVKKNSDDRPRITVSNAVNELIQQARRDGKSKERLSRFETILGLLGEDLNVEVHTITPDIISRWLAGLKFSERTKRNYKDFVSFFCRWLVMRGYLAKGTDWLEGVQKYSARKFGAVAILTPEELKKLLNFARTHKRYKNLVPLVAIGAFAGLRHSEIARLNWEQVELSDKDGESFIEVRAIEKTKSDQRRRLVPVRDCLKAWLVEHKKQSGPVCSYRNSWMALLKLAAKAGVEWRHNSLRHSCVSYQIAESGDVAKVADLCGNSPAVIRSNYLRRVKPAQAEAWFNVLPE